MTRPRDGMLTRVQYKVMPEVCKLVPDFQSEREARDWYVKHVNRSAWKKRIEAGTTRNLFDTVVLVGGPRQTRTYDCTTLADRKYQSSLPNMQLGWGRWNPMEVMHVLAHILQPADSPWHGAEFSQTFFDLVQLAEGKAMRGQVRKIFLAHKIKTRTVSTDTREKRREAFLNRKGVDAKTEAQKMLAELRGWEQQSGEGR